MRLEIEGGRLRDPISIAPSLTVVQYSLYTHYIHAQTSMSSPALCLIADCTINACRRLQELRGRPRDVGQRGRRSCVMRDGVGCCRCSPCVGECGVSNVECEHRGGQGQGVGRVLYEWQYIIYLQAMMRTHCERTPTPYATSYSQPLYFCCTFSSAT